MFSNTRQLLEPSFITVNTGTSHLGEIRKLTAARSWKYRKYKKSGKNKIKQEKCKSFKILSKREY